MKVLKMFDDIKLPVKMGGIGLLVIVALALPTYYFVQISLDSQSSADTELQGIQPTSKVVKLKKVMAEHRGMSAKVLNGDISTINALSSKAKEVDAQLKNVESAISSAASESGLLSELKAISF